MIADTFIYDPEDASFYTVPSDVGRKMLSGGNVTSPVAATAGRNHSPFELATSHGRSPLLCFTTEDELEEKWQRLHPSFWSSGDVLDVIFYVASKSPHGLDAVHNLRGEKFQNLSGSDLYRMTRQDFRDRDSVYGDLLFDCIHELLTKSEFYPPADISPTNFELNNVEILTDKDYMTPFDDTCDPPPQRSSSIPIPVQEIMDAEGDDEPSPLDLVARADCPCGDEGPEDAGKCQCVQIYGHEYSIDNDADFSGILMQPNLVTGVDVQLGGECCVYTDLSTADLRRSTAGIDYSVCSRPIDLRTGPMYRRPSMQAHDYSLASLVASSGATRIRTHPVTAASTPHEGATAGGGRVGPGDKSSRKTPKRPKDGVDERQTKKPGNRPSAGKTNTGSNGRHLWEFIRDLLLAGDNGDMAAADIIRWENRDEGIFRIVDSKQVAELWGIRKRNKTMTYEKLSRALRWSRSYGFLQPMPKDGPYPKKLCFRFGDLANWRD